MAFFIAFFLAVLASVGQVLLKVGAGRHVSDDGPANGAAAVVRMLAEPTVLMGLGIYAFCAFAWLWVLSRLRVSEAYLILSFTFVFVPVIARFTLGERLTTTQWVGAVLICAGVAVLLLGAQADAK